MGKLVFFSSISIFLRRNHALCSIQAHLALCVFAYHESYRRLGRVNTAHQLMMLPVRGCQSANSWNS